MSQVWGAARRRTVGSATTLPPTLICRRNRRVAHWGQAERPFASEFISNVDSDIPRRALSSAVVFCWDACVQGGVAGCVYGEGGEDLIIGGEHAHVE